MRHLIPSSLLSIGLVLLASCQPKNENEPDRSSLQVDVGGQVSVNGQSVAIRAKGSYDPKTRAYELADIVPADSRVEARQRLLLSLCPRVALAFVASNGAPSLLEAGQDGLQIKLTARRKVDKVSSVLATVKVTRGERGLSVQCDGRIETPADRAIEDDGEAVIRIGVNPVTGTFSGGFRINYDVTQQDPAELGTADFWNLDGDFEGARAEADRAYVHVDRCGGKLDERRVQGIVSHFSASTLVLPGILTFSGVAHRDGVIHQFLGISNQAGAGRTLVTFPVKVRKGMTAAEVAAAVQEGFVRSRERNPEMRYILATQGGDGVTSTERNPASAQVAVSMTLDGETIATPAAVSQNPLNRAVAVQAFSDQGVMALENSGIRNQFGVLGQDPLTGWLTPFKIIFTTDNPEAGNQTAGGDVAVLLNWTESVGGTRQQEGSTTSFGDLVIPTAKGQSAEELMKAVAAKLKAQRTPWGTYPFIQREGNVLYIDAGIEFPHIVSLASRDDGVGYMSAAADLPFFAQ